MTRATRRDKYTEEGVQVLYVAFELGVDEWKLGCTKDLGTPPRMRVMPARDLKRLAREIAAAKQWFGLSATAAVRSCYEAGRDGFWLHRYLVSRGSRTVWWTRRASRSTGGCGERSRTDWTRASC